MTYVIAFLLGMVILIQLLQMIQVGNVLEYLQRAYSMTRDQYRATGN